MPRAARVRLVYGRRISHGGTLRCACNIPLHPYRQSTLGEQSPPDLHQPSELLQQFSCCAGSLWCHFRSSIIPFSTSSQLSGVVAPSNTERQSRSFQVANQTLCFSYSGGRRMGRCISTGGRDVLWYKDTKTREPATRHDGQYVVWRRRRVTQTANAKGQAEKARDAAATSGGS